MTMVKGEKAQESKNVIRRSRKGCHNCKRLKIKCDEQKPKCSYCVKTATDCDYSIKLTWGGRPYKNAKRRSSENGGNPSIKKQNGSTLQFVMANSKSLNYTSDEMSQLELNNSLMSEHASSPHIKIENNDLNIEPEQPVIDNHQRTPPALSEFLNTIQNGDTLNNSFNPDTQIPIVSPSESGLKHLPDRDNISESFVNVFSNMPDLSNGIESLSNALEKIVDGGSQLFGLQNSEIFNRFISTMEDKRSPGGSIPPPSPNMSIPSILLESPGKIDDDFLENYSNDLAKIEAYLPKEKPLLGYYNSLIPSRNSNFNRISSYLSKLDGQDDEEVQEIPMDFDNSPSSSALVQQLKYHFDTIPPLLNTLPELLNQVPYYKQLMHFWVNVAAENLVPAPSNIYKDNPFKVLLPQMAMEYPAILTTILAYAATSMALITGKEAPTEIVEQLVSRSCTMLLKMLQDKNEATSDGTLATVLLLSCYELLSANNFEKHRAHYLGARQIIMARQLHLGHAPQSDSSSIATVNKSSSDNKDSPDSNLSGGSSTNSATEGNITFFLMRWFVYVDVIGALSATRNGKFYLHQPEQDSFLASAVDLQNMQNETETIDPKRDIDYVLGFDVKFLSHFTDIVVLIRQTDEFIMDNPESDVIPIAIVTKGLEVINKLTLAFSDGEARRQAIIDKMYDNRIVLGDSPGEIHKRSKRYHNLIKQDNILRCTNRLFFDMGLLSLYRRVLRVPRNSHLIQEITHEMAEILNTNIKSLSSAEICSIFCLFCAGCDTLEEHFRLLFKERFTKLAQSGNVHAAKGLQIMQRCWETGEDWIEASRSLDIDITLL